MTPIEIARWDWRPHHVRDFRGDERLLRKIYEQAPRLDLKRLVAKEMRLGKWTK